ncbi:MAG: GDSL-type esterase/lipase family protein [Bacteroidota bacterium]
MMQDKKENVIIAHFGDSHVQPDHSTAVLREALQDKKGSGGRGMIFPYAIAKTYSQWDYTSSFTGSWRTGNNIQTPPRVPVGICGFAAETSDSIATFTFRFKKPLEPGPKKIKVYCNKNAGGYKVMLKSRGITYSASIGPDENATLPYVLLEADAVGDTLEFAVMKSKDGTTFSLLGVLLEETTPGLKYLDLGVGGANFTAILYQSYFKEQLSELKPDLVVLDWGTNDIVSKNAIPYNMEATIKSVIKQVRVASPTTCILLTSVQDMNLRRRNITAAAPFSKLVERIAMEENCLFYDWYLVAGGSRSMKSWVANGIGGGDALHLTGEGYRLKGRLLAAAILKTIRYYESVNRDSLILPDSLPSCFKTPIIPDKSQGLPTAINNGKQGYRIIIIKKGECLSMIAERYRISIKELKRINGLKGDTIRAGDKLKVPKR